MRQRLYRSTNYGGYNLVRQSDERYVAHYASLAATLHPLHELMLKHAPNVLADRIHLAIALPDPAQPWAAAAYTAYHATLQTADVPPDIILRAHRVTPHPRLTVKAGLQHTRVDSGGGYRRPRIPPPSELHTRTVRYLQSTLGPALRMRQFAATESRLLDTGNDTSLVRMYGAATGGQHTRSPTIRDFTRQHRHYNLPFTGRPWASSLYSQALQTIPMAPPVLTGRSRRRMRSAGLRSTPQPTR